MGQRTNFLLQVEGRSGARLNRVYHFQWGYRKYLPMAFLRLLSSRYFKPEKTDVRDYYHPKYKLGFLLGPENLEGEPPFSRWVTTEEYMRHQPGYKGEYDDIFAHAFDALTILSGTQHVVQAKDKK